MEFVNWELGNASLWYLLFRPLLRRCNNFFFKLFRKNCAPPRLRLPHASHFYLDRCVASDVRIRLVSVVGAGVFFEHSGGERVFVCKELCLKSSSHNQYYFTLIWRPWSRTAVYPPLLPRSPMALRTPPSPPPCFLPRSYVVVFSDISERNNDYSDTLDFRRG